MKKGRTEITESWDEMVARWGATPTFTRDTPPKKKKADAEQQPAKKARKIRTKNAEEPLQNYLKDSTGRGDAPKSKITGGKGWSEKAKDQRYTGTKVLGVAVMHKSSMVPVFSGEEAVEISKMRRG